MLGSEVLIRKADGSEESFSPEKLFQSLVRSGARAEDAEAIVTRVANELHSGDKTHDIYRRAFSLLRHGERAVAARYSVKRVLLELGPSGYPFEDFVAEIFRAQGYHTQTRIVLEGKCVTHELDMIAEKNGERILAEVKYHNNAELRSDVKVPLYVRARLDDVFAREGKESRGMIVTNTKFSEQAEVYGACAGLSLLSWDYPEKGNLRELIEETRVHPLSCLTTLSKAQKRLLMEGGVVLTRQVVEKPEVLFGVGVSERKREVVLQEIHSLEAE
jgi:hypothetical protein